MARQRAFSNRSGHGGSHQKHRLWCDGSNDLRATLSSCETIIDRRSFVERTVGAFLDV